MHAARKINESYTLELSREDVRKLLKVFDKISSCEIALIEEEVEEWSEADYRNASEVGFSLQMSFLAAGFHK